MDNGTIPTAPKPAKRTAAPRKPAAPKAPRTKKAGAAKGVTLTLSGQPGMKVFVAGSFNQWDPTSIPMVEKKGTYSATLDLEPGIYEYKFVIDGVWTLDPNPERDWTQNGLGTLNSLLRVG